VSPRPFRFGAVAVPGADWPAQVRRLAGLGFDVLLSPDRPHLPSPLPALAVAAATSSRLHVGTYVLAGSLHEPAAAARDCWALDALSGGRFEPGFGAGLDPAPPAGRLERLRALVGATRGRLPQARLLVAASGRRALELASQVADMVALSLPPQSDESAVAQRVGWLLEAAGARGPAIELNLNLAAVGEGPAPHLEFMGLRFADLRAAGSIAVLWGDADQMCAQLERRRERLGVSYWSAPEAYAEVMAPVIQRLSGR